MKRLVFTLAVILLTGCVSNTTSELKNEKGNFDGKIVSDSNYQAVFRSLRNMSKICLEHHPLGTPVTTEGEIDQDIKEGQIRQRMVAQGVLLTTSVIDVRDVKDSKTEVTLYTVKGWRGVGIRRASIKDVARWIEGDKRCWSDG